MANEKNTTPLPFEFEVAKRVTLALIKMEDETPFYCTVEGAIYKSKPVNGAGAVKTADGAKSSLATKEPPELMHVVDLRTGELGQIIVNKVLGDNLRESYKNDSYVGKSFEIIRHKIGGGKKYATFSITEIALKGSKSGAKVGKK